MLWSVGEFIFNFLLIIFLLFFISSGIGFLRTYISQQRKVIDNTPNYSHDINDYNGQNDIDIENMVNIQNTIDPINLNQDHYFKNKNNISNQIYNQHDHSLKTRSATHMAPQYLGHNFSQAF